MIRSLLLSTTVLFSLFNTVFAATRVAYTRPGVMMKIPFGLPEHLCMVQYLMLKDMKFLNQ